MENGKSYFLSEVKRLNTRANQVIGDIKERHHFHSTNGLFFVSKEVNVSQLDPNTKKVFCWLVADYNLKMNTLKADYDVAISIDGINCDQETYSIPKIAERTVLILQEMIAKTESCFKS